MKQKFIDLLFNDDEYACWSPNKYATISVPKNEINLDKTVLLALNPFKPESTRNDISVSKYRSFLVEIDNLPIPLQYRYVKALKVPFSACIFSGNKSLHFCITLADDLPSIQVYQLVAQWILNIVKRADQNCKNPSRCIRFPGVIRPGTNKEQKLLELRKRVSQEELFIWLNKYQELRPTLRPEREKSEVPNYDMIKSWVKKELEEGLDFTNGRSNRWYAVAFEFALAGYSEEEIEDILDPSFVEERDFTRKKWLGCIKDAYKKVQRRG